MDIKTILAKLDHNPFWLDRYISFLEETPQPTGLFDRHHILPQAVFPDYKSFQTHSWNRIDLRPADHLLAHYYLYRALPGVSAARAAFILMVGLRYVELVEQNFDEALVKDVAKAYEEARAQGVESTIKGWVRIYRTEKECSVCPPDQVESYVALGWTTGVPKRVWVMRGVEQHRILLSEMAVYLQSGYVLGKNLQTDETKTAISKAITERHEKEQTKDDAYSYMPRGDQHHRRILGCPPEVAAKISKTLKGRPQPSTHPVGQGISIAKGKHWQWSDESRQARSESMKGIVPTNGLTMAGKTHDDETRRLMSESHKEFYASNPEGVAALDAARPRGENHVFFGKERDAATRDKISKSLEGKTQSEATRLKRSESLKAFHTKKTSEIQVQRLTVNTGEN
jgi:hypothetical protein